MRRRLLALLPLAAALWLAAFAGGRSEPFYLGGIQVNEPDHERWVTALAEAGFDTVQVTVYAHQGDWDSANLWWEEEEPWVVAEIRAARAKGLQVVLVLRVALDHAFDANRFLWHGMIMPATGAELDEWFARYTRFAEKWARIAREEGVDLLAVGSELNSLTNTVQVTELPPLEEYWTNPEKVERERRRVLEHAEGVETARLEVPWRAGYDRLDAYLGDRDAAHQGWARRVSRRGEPGGLAAFNARRARLERGWREVVARVRREYPGPVTYAANFDQYEEVGFWDALDLIGINAYFPLLERITRERKPVDLETLFAARWKRILGSIDAFRRQRGLPEHRVLFTEIGYVSRVHSTVQPWAATGFSVLPAPEGSRLVVWQEQSADPMERALAVRGLYLASREVAAGELLAGLLYWKLSTVASHREVEPFVLILGEEGAGDPLLDELARFARRPRGAGRWALPWAGLAGI
ncbi:MAG: hypothetical protein R3325_02995 [Thermoanaerobaculia bacterium]|nr:hypothetical protein [Thermoanaerobaculia bacterium]